MAQWCSFFPEHGNWKPPPVISGYRGVVDVPGSHHCKSSEPSGGSFTDPFFSFSALAFGMTLSPENSKSCAVNMQM